VSPDDLREWYADYLAACNRHDLPAIRALLAPDVRRAHRPSGADAWIRDLDDLFHAFPDFQWKRVTVVVEDDRLAAHLRAGGTHRATGRHVNVAEFAIYRIEGGRIAEYAGTADTEALVAQLR